MRRALLVHGLSSSSESWWRVADALAEDGWSVTAVDPRGHGDAQRADRYALTDYATDLSGEWDLVVGHSLGGAVSVLAAQHPGFARRLLLLDPVLDVPVQEYDDILADQLSELDLTEEAIVREKPHWHERDRATKLAGVRAANAFAVEHTFTDTGRWDVRTETAALRVPTLILGGDHAVYSMLATETADALTDANPLIEYRVVAGAGHSPHRDKPEETIAAVREWLLLH